MLSQEDFKRLARLLNNLYLCTGVKFALMDEQGREFYTSSHRAPFCSQIMSDPEGAERCYACDRQAVHEAVQNGQPRKYMCHAGLYEIAMPVMDGQSAAAVILFGQMLDDAPRDVQWERIERHCPWQHDKAALHEAFLRLRRISAEQMDACMEIVQACISEVRLHGLHTTDNRDDALRLRMYIDVHYAEPLDSDALAAALHAGKTKLYAICQKRFGLTPMQLVTQTRIAAAQELLSTSGESIKTIAQAVGFADQNYFVKVFKKNVGCTPTAYRRQQKLPQ